MKGDHLFPVERDTIRGFRVAYVVFAEENYVRDLMEVKLHDVEPVILRNSPTGGVAR